MQDVRNPALHTLTTPRKRAPVKHREIPKLQQNIAALAFGMSAEPTREQVDALAGPTVLEFGATWCGFCQRARPLIDGQLAAHPEVRHVRIEDGSGKPLGRSFRVKLWPTFVFLLDGVEVARLVRPRSAQDVRDAMNKLR